MNFKSLLLFITAPLLLFSCLTPQVPSVSDTSGTLLVIPAAKRIEEGLSYNSGVQIHFRIELNEVDAPLRVGIKDPYTFIGHLEPGNYNSRSIQPIIQLQSGYSGDTGTSPVPLLTYFELEEGTITIFPYRVIYYLETTTSGLSSGWELEELGDREIRAILKDLESQENFHQWAVQ